MAANTADRTLSITVDGKYKLSSGSLFVSKITNSNGDVIAKNEDYTYDLVAGEYTVTFGMLSSFGASADSPLTFNVENKGELVIPEPEPDPEPGEGESTGVDGTYISEKHASGRYLKVIIDTTAGTMTLVRSNMSGGWDASTSTFRLMAN